MHTTLRSRSSTVVIGHDQPFCVIGERINPTGRKAFAEELRGGDLSTVAVDAVAQVTAGAGLLRGNARAPPVGEAQLLQDMVRPGGRAPPAPPCIAPSGLPAAPGRPS